MAAGIKNSSNVKCFEMAFETTMLWVMGSGTEALEEAIFFLLESNIQNLGLNMPKLISSVINLQLVDKNCNFLSTLTSLSHSATVEAYCYSLNSSVP